MVRDTPDQGARLTFEHPVIVPDNIELFIPQKQQSLRACARRRETSEIGVAFEVERSDEPRHASDAELQRRVATLEREIAALRRLVSEIKDKVLHKTSEQHGSLRVVEWRRDISARNGRQ